MQDYYVYIHVYMFVINEGNLSPSPPPLSLPVFWLILPTTFLQSVVIIVMCTAGQNKPCCLCGDITVYGIGR